GAPHRPRPLHPGAGGPQYRELGPLHSRSPASLLPRSLRLRRRALPGGLRELPADAQPAAQPAAHRSRRGGRHRGGARRRAAVPALMTPPSVSPSTPVPRRIRRGARGAGRRGPELRLGWIGFHAEGVPALEALVAHRVPIAAVITLNPPLAAKRSAAADYISVCRRFNLPLYQVADVNDDDTVALLQSLSLDLVFVLGWSQILR